MSSDIAGETEVSDGNVTVPEEIRVRLDIEDGDHLRWRVGTDDTLVVEVVRQRTGTFAEFEPFDGDNSTDAVVEHDSWGVE
jgi:bifunctional DNA-binding transcriptional regulator/antitoxin component of YhaV-PrlF toxin-antitoxin module